LPLLRECRFRLLLEIDAENALQPQNVVTGRKRITSVRINQAMVRPYATDLPDTRRRRWSRTLLGFVCVAAIAVAPAGAEEPWHTEFELTLFSQQGTLRTERTFSQVDVAEGRTVAPREVFSSRLLTSHLLPSVSHQLDRIAATHPVTGLGEDAGSHMMFDTVTRAVHQRASRGFRRGLGDYLLETTPLSRLDNLVSMHRRSGGGESPVSFGLRASHGRPAVEFRRKGEDSSVRLSLGGDGLVRLGFWHARTATTRFTAAYDIDSGDVLLGCRIGL